ncbi:MAG TPA: hypothetical protein VJZ27_00840, partial [Aggregatilineales bacterium]|nr:hypothetical protein [Aggregatilineales bacterium]
DDHFTLVNPENLQQLERVEPVQSLGAILPLLSPFIGIGMMLATVLAFVYLLFQKDAWRGALFLLAWIFLIVFLSVIAASQIRTRYLMPVSAPLVLVVAYAAVLLWENGQSIMRGILTLGFAVWLGLFAVPFVIQAMRDPNNLPLSESDRIRYLSGNFSGDALRAGAEYINQLDSTGQEVYSTWGTCQLLYFYLDREITCLPPAEGIPAEALLDDMQKRVDSETGEWAYFLTNGLSTEGISAALEWELLETFPRSEIDRPVQIWRVRWIPGEISG